MAAGATIRTTMTEEFSWGTTAENTLLDFSKREERKQISFVSEFIIFSSVVN